MFEYQGKQYTLEDLQRSATQQGYDNFDEFMQLYKDDGMVEVEQTFEPIQFEQQVEEQEISSWQSFKNSIYNAFEQTADVPEFYTSEEGAGSSFDIAATLLYEAAFGKEKIKEWKQTDFGQWFFSDIGGGGGYEGSDTESFRKSIEAFEEEQQETKRTMTFKEADSFADYLSVSSGAIVNVGGSVAYNLLTGGTGFFMQFASENFITANEEKAKANNTTIDNLLKSGDHDVEAPIKIAAFQAGLELFGFSKIISKTGVGKKLNKKVGEYLTKNYKTSKNIRTGLDILGTGRTEAFTEMGQTGLEIYNKELAVAKGKGEDINDFESIVNGMFSEDGIEAGLQGFFGGAGLKGGAYSAKALNSIRSTEKTLDVEKDLNSLVNLTKRYNSSKDEDVRFAINEEIKTVEKTIKNKIKKGNDIYNSLSNKDIKNIENITDLSDVTAARAISLIEKFKNKQIPEADFNIALKGLTKKYKEHKENILKILYEKNIQFAITEGEKIGKEVVEIQSLDEFQKKYNEIRTEGDFEGDVTARDGFIKGNKIFINKQTALKEGAISVGSHELLHGVIGQSFDKLNLNDKKKLGKSFIGFLNKEQEAAVRKRLKESYGLEGDAIFETEEIFTAFSDAITKNEITFNETIFQKIGLAIQELMNKLIPGYKKEFKNGRQAYEFLKEYQANVKEGKLGERVLAFAEQDKDVIGAKFKVKPSLSKEAVDQIKERVTEIGLTYNMKGGKKLWDEGGSKAAIDEITKDGLLNDLIASKYKVSPVPENFVKDVLAQLLPDIRGFNPEENNDFGGYLGPRINFRAGDVYKDIYEKKGPATVPTEAKTKEGEVKVQVKAEKDVEMQKLEEKDISIAAQIKEAKAKKEGKTEVEKTSKFRKEFGIKTGDKVYSKVLETARVALKRAYEVGTSVRNIQRKLATEANVYKSPDGKKLYDTVLAKLGTKKAYFENLAKFRVPITNLMFTADLVQMEREIADDKKVFTRFVKKLTTLKEVQDAVDNLQLPPSAIDSYKRDKSVNLYKKLMPSEEQFIAYFNQPLNIPNPKNPKTTKRSNVRGERKQALARRIVAGLSFDATIQVAQEPDVIQARKIMAEMKGETIDVSDIQNLAAAIGRDPSVKFSLSSEQITENLQDKIEELVNKANQDKFYFNKIITVERDKNGKAISYKLNIPLERDKSMPGPRQHSKENKEAVARIVYKYITNNEYGSIVSDKKLQSEILREIILDNKKGKTTNAGIAHENIIKKQLQKTVSLIKNSILQIVGGGKLGDIYASLGNIKVGIETKLEKARGVSQLLTFLNNNLDINFPNKNTTTNDKGDLFDDIIGKQAKKQYNKFLKDLPKQLGEVKNFTLTQEQADWLVKNGRSNYLIETQVPIEHISSAYASGKYKDAPQGFIVIGRNIYRMVTGNSTIDNLTERIVSESGLNIQNLQLTKGKNVKLVGEFMSNIGKNKKVNFRIADRINAADYEVSNVDITKNQVNKKFINAINDVLNKQSIVRLSKSAMFSRSANNPTKGITVLDFDDTLATTESLVKFTRPDGTTGTLNAEQYASTYEDLLDQGFTFDFTEFNKVVKGKIAPLFQKALKLQGKFGPKNMFVLTARPPAAANAIHVFLKANGLNIPLKNITGLANSTAEAKALWMAGKVGEGYNDFYFADDALQNVKAVKNMLDQLDVKSKVQQAKVKFSRSMNDRFNDILENVTGIESKKRFSIIKGRKRGESKGKFRFFIPPSHEDFVGLLYNFLGKGKEGNAHRDFFEQALIRPLNRANREYDTARQSVANDYKALNKQFADVRKKLKKQTPDGDFTYEDAIRIYLWNKHGHKIPGLSETDQAKLSELVMNDSDLRAYAENLNIISKQETYVDPTDGWNGGDIRMDLDDATGRIGRQQFFAEFIENTDIIFSEENLNKIEAGYGKGVRESLEDMLYRIKTGRNRPTGQNAQVNKLMNYLNGSVGTVMFFNMRSALLQQMSIVNYINFADNNIFAAAKAFANQKQYWADWAFIFNSDMLKQRRGGIQTDVNGAELAASLRNSKDITRKLISKLLELGFLPTQIGDNIAIATGGAAYYRNRINKYIKQGMSQKEAEAVAFTDFQDITQSTQQSARPDMVSKQQASVIGKVILNFQNVTSQFNRLGKKAFQDIYNRRITKPNETQMQSDISNAARITYYFAVQNAIFYTLQTALFAMMFDDDEEDNNKLFLKKRERLINGSIDSVLRGTGLIGGVVATLKNMAIAFARQRDVDYNPDESAVGLEALNLSPVLGIKLRKIVNAEKTLNYNKKVIKEMETFDIDNPQWSAVTNYTEAITNVPLNRLYNKTQNVRQALNNDHSAWERTLMFLGWSQYNLDLENKKMEDIKESIKTKKKEEKKKTFKPKKFKAKSF